MPLHFNAITNDYKNSTAFAWILQKGMDECDSIFVSQDQQYFHIQAPLTDVLSQDEIGKMVYTIKRDNEHQVMEILDVDFVLLSDECVNLHFLNKRSGSSDSNEYYEVETVAGEQHLEVETVNRHTVTTEIEGEERSVRISVFPFELSVYKDISSFNSWVGFTKEIDVGNTGLKVNGLSETFAMPGGLLNNKKDDESYSFLVGKVKSFRDVRIQFGEVSWDFVLAKVLTALGTVPVAMGREVFDLEKLVPEAIVAMNADVKADLSKPEDFTYPNQE
jgi:hypothetical protein